MVQNYRTIVYDALYTSFCEGLRPFVLQTLQAYSPNWWDECFMPIVNESTYKGKVSSALGSHEEIFTQVTDPYLLFKLITAKWMSSSKSRVPNRDLFQKKLTEFGINYIEELMTVRNESVAHSASALSLEDALRAFDTMARLLEATGNKDRATELRGIAAEISGPQITSSKQHMLGLQLFPVLPSDFVGRTLEVNELNLALREDQLGVIVYGGGGVGKTTLMTKLAKQIKRKYSDRQIYLDLKGAGIEVALSMKEIATYIIQALEPQLSLPDDESTLIQWYQRLAFTKRVKDDKEEPREPRRVLLFLDNVASAEQVRYLVPPDNSSVMLLTSRQQFDLRGFHSLSLDVLPHDEAVRLLLAIAHSVLDEPQADIIAALLGDYPLALIQAGRYLAEDIDADPIEYISKLQQRPSQRLGLIERSLRLSYDALNAEMQKIWHEIAIFSGSFDVQAASAICDLDLETTRKHVNSLSRRSLVKHNRKPQRYQLHDLHREFALHQLTSNERAEIERRHAFYFLETAITTVCKTYLGDEEAEKQAVDLFEWDWPNYQVAWAWASEQAESDISVARLCYCYLDEGWPLITQRQPANEWVDWLKRSLADAHEVDDTFTELRRSYHLAQAYESANEQTHAIVYYARAEDLARSGFSDHPALPLILSSLGKLLAKDLISIAHDIRSAVLGHYNNAYAYPASVVWDLANIPAKIAVEEQWVVNALFSDDGEKSRQRDQSREIDVDELRRQSTAIRPQGKRAVDYLIEAADLFHQLGYELDELNVRVQLSEVYAALGELESAIETAQCAIALAKEIDPDRVGEIEWTILDGCYTGLGHHFLYIGEPRKALEFYKEFLLLFSEHQNHMEADVLEGMISAYLMLGETAKAFECRNSKATLLMDEMGTDIDEMYALDWRVSLKLEQAGYRKLAISEMRDCIDGELQSKLPKAAEHMWYLGLVYEKSGDLEKAIDQMVECVELEIEAEHPEAGEHMAYLESLRVQWASQRRGKQ